MSASPPLVMHVIHHLVTGGMENGLVNLVNRLPADRFRHAIVCIEDHSDFRSRITRPDVDVIALHRSSVGRWRMRQQLYRLCRERRPTILHTRNMSGLDALLPARVAGVPHCVHGEHGWDVGDIRGERRRPILLRRLHSPMVDRYVTVSRHLQQYLIERVGIAAHRIEHICNGVDVTRFTPAGAAHEPLRAAFAGEPDAVVVGTVARMQPVKDHATLVNAVATVVRTAPPDIARRVRLAIVGDGPLLAATRDLVRERGLENRAWLPGSLADVPAVLRGLDLFVLPSLGEGISNTLLEAMATGLPVVATHVGGNVELVEEGRTGRFFAPGDVASLASHIVDFVRDAALRRSTGEEARRQAVARFSIDRMVSSYQALYEGVCANRALQAA